MVKILFSSLGTEIYSERGSERERERNKKKSSVRREGVIGPSPVIKTPSGIQFSAAPLLSPTRTVSTPSLLRSLFLIPVPELPGAKHNEGSS